MQCTQYTCRMYQSTTYFRCRHCECTAHGIHSVWICKNVCEQPVHQQARSSPRSRMAHQPICSHNGGIYRIGESQQSIVIHSTTVQSNVIHSTTVQSTVIHSTTVQSTVILNTAVQSTTVQRTTVQSTAVQSTTVHSTTVQSTTVQSTTLQVLSGLTQRTIVRHVSVYKGLRSTVYSVLDVE